LYTEKSADRLSGKEEIMDKKFLFVVFSFPFLILGSLAMASDWNYNLGIQYWKPDWSYEKDIYEYSGSTDGLLGPIAFLGFRQYGLGIQYYSGDFKVDVAGVSSKKNRKDLDIYFNYRFLKYCNFMLGYKNLNFQKGETENYNLKTTVDGFGFGLNVGYLFNPYRIYVFGAGFYLPKLTGEEKWAPRSSEYQSESYDVDAKGYNLEFGAGYLLPIYDHSSLNFKASYRMQNFKYEYNSIYIYDADEKFDGIRLEISFIF
jgi:hypothetical protein